MEKMSFQAHLRYILTTDLAAFLVAVLIVLLATRIRSLLSPLALVLVIAVLALVFIVDVALWLTRGIRSVEVDEQSLTIYRGRDLKATVIPRQQVAGIVIRKRLMRRAVTVKLSRFKAERITEEAFSAEVFSRFLSVLAGWDQRN
jgi:hypothetical protein